MKLGIIAGNGRFPFLVLDAARAEGHDVTVIGLKEETFKELEGAAAEARAPFHWISIGQLGACIRLLKSAGASHGCHSPITQRSSTTRSAVTRNTWPPTRAGRLLPRPIPTPAPSWKPPGPRAMPRAARWLPRTRRRQPTRCAPQRPA